MKTVTLKLYLALLGCLMFTEARAWDPFEHRLLGDSVYVDVMRQCADQTDDSTFVLKINEINIRLNANIQSGKSFGSLCSLYAENDLCRNRFHDYGCTILEQIRKLSANKIESSLNDFKVDWQKLPKTSGRNVVESYFLYHLAAMHQIQKAGSSENETEELISRAFLIEAIAQGYLADAFASGHILTPVSDFLAFLHPRNNKESHNYHRNDGAWVVNSRGDAWQTFGDKLMHWYGPTYRPVLEACQSSLKELMVVFYQSGNQAMPDTLLKWLNSSVLDKSAEDVVANWLSINDGEVYYSKFKMPTLMLIPMPVSASWSVRTDIVDSNGIHWRRHYPQLKEEGLHDPDLHEIDTDFLYSRKNVPKWMIPEPLLDSSISKADLLVKEAPDWASVRWVQKRYFMPSYKGFLFHVGGQAMFKDNHGEIGGNISVGYGLCDDLMILKNISLDVSYLPSVYEPRRSLIVSTVGVGVPVGIFDALGSIKPLSFIKKINLMKPFKAFHFDGGYAWGVHSEYDQRGWTYSFGIDSKVIPLKFTYIGITIRAKYQIFRLDETLDGPSLELIFQ